MEEKKRKWKESKRSINMTGIKLHNLKTTGEVCVVLYVLIFRYNSDDTCSKVAVEECLTSSTKKDESLTAKRDREANGCNILSRLLINE